MHIGVEISLYPLHADYIPPIQQFIDRLNGIDGLRVITNSMSTQVFGDYELVMGTLVRELRQTFLDNDKAVFVMKVLGPLASP
jgi:uncharacterized protein YqgV (UPF0045/DUF77 family)